MAEVSRSALQMVKDAMVNYSSDSALILQKLGLQASESVAVCSQKLISIVQQKNDLQVIVDNQCEEMKSKRQHIEVLACRIKKYQDDIIKLTNAIKLHQQTLINLDGVLRNLYNKLSFVRSDNDRMQIENEIERIKNEINVVAQKKAEAEQCIGKIQADLHSSQAEQLNLKKELGDLETCYAKNKLKFKKICDKCERLKSAFIEVQNSTDGLLNALKRLQRDDIIKKNISCIDLCIDTIDEYLNVNF